MNCPAKINRINLPDDKRIICISDIHGNLDLFKALLDKAGFCEDDVLILLGDLYLKGPKPHDTLKFCIKLAEKPNVHILKGNCDWGREDYLSEQEVQWLDSLPDIIHTDKFIFVHSGIASENLEEEQTATVMKYDNFVEAAPSFDRWVVVGHWPVSMYCHDFPRHSPIVNEEKRIIAIDGGNVLKPDGQLNAFIIQGGGFSHMSVDGLPTIIIEKDRAESAGKLAITWNDRFVEIVEDGTPLCRVRHLQIGEVLAVPKSRIWTDRDGNACICDMATDHHLPVKVGDAVKVVGAFPDRIFAKMGDVSGWIMI